MLNNGRTTENHGKITARFSSTSKDVQRKVAIPGEVGLPWGMPVF